MPDIVVEEDKKGTDFMGMSAAQARLLSITTRLTNNEFRSQTITNSKLRLADKSAEASQEYMNALNSQKLMFANYNDNASKTYTPLTANTLLNFSELKNQYCLVNSAGQILALPQDIKNYDEAAGSMDKFLELSGIPLVKNDVYYQNLTSLYGADYSSFSEDYEAGGAIYNNVKNKISDLIGSINSETFSLANTEGTTLTKSDGSEINVSFNSINGYDTFMENYSKAIAEGGLSSQAGGKLYAWYKDLQNIPKLEMPEKPVYTEKEAPKQEDYKKQAEIFQDAWNAYVEAAGINAETPLTGKETLSALSSLFNKGSIYKTSDGISFEANGNDETPEDLKNASKSLMGIEDPKLDALKQNLIDAYYKAAVLYADEDTKTKMNIPSDAVITFEKSEEDKNTDAKNVEDKLKEMEAAKSDYEAVNTVLKYHEQVKTEKESEFNVAKEDYEAAKKVYDVAVRNYNASIGDSSEAYFLEKMNEAEIEMNTKQVAFDSAKSSYDEATEAYNTYNEGKVTPAKTTLDSATEIYNKAVEEQNNPNKTFTAGDDAIEYLAALLKNSTEGVKDLQIEATVDDVEAFQAAMTQYNTDRDAAIDEYAQKVEAYNENLKEIFKNLYVYNETTGEDSYRDRLSKWTAEHVEKNDFIDSLETTKKHSYKIPDQKDSKYQWYVNLWYKMGAGKSNNYKEFDMNLLNNAEWLQFALEHGVLTLEQAQFIEDGSEKYPDMGTYDWVSIIYTNASDVVYQEDETAIAIAEVKYKNKINEIENKDKKFDQDLKKLDTEHSALQTEYESIKEAMNKNIERSFKAFS